MQKVQGMDSGTGRPIGRARWLDGLKRTGICWVWLLTASVLTACGSLQPTQETSSPPTAERREVRLGLALGGGAARGFAHVGVIQVLEEAGIRPSHVAGTSAGSLVAALYASGKTPAELLRVAESMQEAEITDWMLPILNRGALRGEALAKYVNTQVGGKTLEQMQIPLGIVATDLGNGQPITFRRGNTGTAVRASSAVPAVFQPVRLGDREYVDGGWFPQCRYARPARWVRTLWWRLTFRAIQKATRMATPFRS